MHRYDYASQHLTSHATYILVQKELRGDGGASPDVTYLPLLDNATDSFPNFQLHVHTVDKKKSRRTKSQSPSPAGVKGKSRSTAPVKRMTSRRK